MSPPGPDLAAAVAALGSEVRLGILQQLRQPKRLSELRVASARTAGGFQPNRPLSRQSVAEHVEKLVEAGLVVPVERVAGTAYTVAPDRIVSVLGQLLACLEVHA